MTSRLKDVFSGLDAVIADALANDSRLTGWKSFFGVPPDLLERNMTVAILGLSPPATAADVFLGPGRPLDEHIAVDVAVKAYDPAQSDPKTVFLQCCDAADAVRDAVAKNPTLNGSAVTCVVASTTTPHPPGRAESPKGEALPGSVARLDLSVSVRARSTQPMPA